MQVTDKIAIITGAGSGIGRALAKRFAADGAQAIICADRSADDAAETAELIGKQASAAALDVSDQEAIEAMVAKTEQDFGRVDILVSNAGYGQPGGLEKPTSDWKHMMDVHTWSHLRISKERLSAEINQLAALNCPVKFEGKGVDIVLSGEMYDVPTAARNTAGWFNETYQILLAVLQKRALHLRSSDLRASFAAQSVKAERKPCTWKGSCMSRSTLSNVMSDIGLPAVPGKTTSVPSIRKASAFFSTANAASDSGTSCARLRFMCSAGIDQRRSSRSNSDQRASRTSCDRVPVRMSRSRARRPNDGLRRRAIRNEGIAT